MARKIRQAAVIGSGVMGGGIAALLAGAGIQTLLLDIVPPDLPEEKRNNPRKKNKIVKAGLDAVLNSKPPLLMDRKDAARIRIGNLEDDFEELGKCDWIVEVVVENLKIKKQLFQRVQNVRKPDSIVSSNTSGLPLRAMCDGLGESFRKHFLGTHFFNPVRYMRLLEIIPGEETEKEVLDFMADFGERILGKGIVWAKDTPNFIANRIGVQQIVMAMQEMRKDGLSVEQVDSLFGPVLGRPKTALFKTCDLVGLDTLAHVAKNTYELVENDERRETFKVPDFIDRMIENKLLGKKSGGGFYKTEKKSGEIVRKVIDPETLQYEEVSGSQFECLEKARAAKSLPEKIKAVVFGDDPGARFAWRVLSENLMYSANRIPEIADSIVDIDNAMKWGYNFELGPFETWDAIGLEKSIKRMKQEGRAVPEKITQMISSGNDTFYKTEAGERLYYDFQSGGYKPIRVSETVICLDTLKGEGRLAASCKSASLVDLGDGVFCCEFHTKMNAINPEIVEFLSEGLDYVDKNGVGMVIGNQAGGTPGAFSAGGDLYFMGTLAQQGKFAEIGKFLEKAQGLMQKARYAPFPVVAAPFGMTLGGGCEICLGAADRMVSHAELYMGLVEVGVGLLPAAGGCLNLWKKFIAAIPEAVEDLDLAKFFVPVFKNIAMANVSSSAAHARAMGFLGPRDRIVFNRDYLIGEAKKEVLRMADAGYAPPLKKKVKVAGDMAQGLVNTELYNMRNAGYISEYDEFLARRVAFVISGGQVRAGSEVEEEVILSLERQAFLDFWKEPKTHARVEHMLKTGKPLRN